MNSLKIPVARSHPAICLGIRYRSFGPWSKVFLQTPESDPPVSLLHFTYHSILAFVCDLICLADPCDVQS